MHGEVAILKNAVASALRDDRGNFEDEKASDAWVCIKAALQRRQVSGRNSRARR